MPSLRLPEIACIAWVCLSLVMFTAVLAQAPPPTNSATPANAKQSEPRHIAVGLGGEETTLLAEFPLNITQKPGIMLPVTFHGKTYTFMFDSGSTHTVVDVSLRPLLGERIKQVESEPSVGGTAPTDLFAPMDATVGPLPLKDCGPVMVADFQSLRKQSKAPCDGVLGMSFIGRYLWMMDWDFQKLSVCESLAPPDQQRKRANAKPVTVTFPVLLPDGHKANTTLDTGYTMPLGLEEVRFDALEQSGAIVNVHRMGMDTAVGTRDVKLGLLREFKFPREKSVDVFRDVMVASSNRPRLGLNFLKAYMVVWDAPAGGVTLVPRSWIRELRKEKGLPDIPSPPGVPEPQVAPLFPGPFSGDAKK